MLQQGQSQGEIVAEALRRDRDQPALILDDGAVVTRGEMADRTVRFVALLDQAGLKPGDRIGVLSRNRPEVVYVCNALALANLTLVPLHPMGSIGDFDHIVGLTSIKALIFDPAHFEEPAAELGRRFGALKLLALGDSQCGDNLLDRLDTVEPAPLEAKPSLPTDINRIATTGGTTGKPKAILLSQHTMVTMLAIQQAEWDWPEDVRCLVCAPLSHSGMALLLPALLRGGVLVIQDGFDPEKVLEAIERHRITCTLLVPTMIYALLDYPERERYDVSSLESVYYGASSIIPERLAQAIRAFGPVFFQFFGQSEAPMTVTVMRRHEHDPDDLRRLSSCGRAVPWMRVKLLDDDNREVPQGEPGEICCQGPLVMEGYLDNPEQTEEAFAGGWLHTGDVAIRDEDGFLHIMDRKKDMIITGGFNVYPREIEDVILEEDSVVDVSVVGIPDPKWGEKVVAYVIPAKGATIDEAAITARVREKKGAVQAPKAILIGEQMPLSPLGKPDKKTVRRLAEERLGASSLP